ncbi:conserved hypothetical protein [Ricinus communis]|uniref:Uncharacterized protein n=1 Tax=Ricinus communis TaxID=3988 RepID=B9R8E1_RICCO|nr:conserved hypothetical protein [Ricinus communis]
MAVSHTKEIANDELASAPTNGPTQKIHCSSTSQKPQIFSLLNVTAAPKLRAGSIPVPVIRTVARCTINTANPIEEAAKT